MRTNQVRTAGGIQLEQAVLACGGTRKDMALVFEEAPDFFPDMAAKLIERAAILRDDKDYFRFTDPDIVIPIPALKLSTEEIQNDRSWIKEIECDNSPQGPVIFRLATVLKSDEPRINGATYKRRLTQLRAEGKLLGLPHLQWLIANQDNTEAIPDKKARIALKALLGNAYIDFPAIIVVDVDGHRNFPCARQSGKRWDEHWPWVRHGLHSDGRVAVSN